MKKLLVVVGVLVLSVSVVAQIRIGIRVIAGGGGGGGGSILTANDMTYEGVGRVGTGCKQRAVGARRATEAGHTGHLHIFCLGPIVGHAQTTVASGSSSTGAVLVDATEFPTGTWIFVGNNWDITQIASRSGNTVTWSPALPGDPGINATVRAEEHLYEYEYAGTGSLTSDINTAPLSSLVQDWGQVYQGKRQSLSGNGGGGYMVVDSLVWDDTNDGVYIQWHDFYNVTGDHHPQMLFADLNDASNTITTYGPWYFQEGPGGHPTGWAGMTRIPSSWSTPNLGSSNCWAMTTMLSSGVGASPFGDTIQAACDNWPGAGTPPNTSGTAFATQQITWRSVSNRQERDGNYFAHYGSVAWNVSVSNTPTGPTTTCAFVDATGNALSGYGGAEGAPAGKPVDIYFRTLNVTRAVTSISGRQICYNATPSPPAVGEIIDDVDVYGGYDLLPAIKYQAGSLSNWTSFGTVGEGAPAGNGWWLDFDYRGFPIWLNDTRTGVLFVGTLGIGHCWYGSGKQCGHDKFDPANGAQGPGCEDTTATLSVWNPTTLAENIVLADYDRGTPTETVDLEAKGMVIVGKMASYPNQTGAHDGAESGYYDTTERLIVAFSQAGWKSGSDYYVTYNVWSLPASAPAPFMVPFPAALAGLGMLTLGAVRNKK